MILLALFLGLHCFVMAWRSDSLIWGLLFPLIHFLF